MFTSSCGADVLFGATSCPTVAVGKLTSGTPPELSLSLPNPLAPPAQIRFAVPHDGERVTLRIHDLLGRAVRTLVDAPNPQARASWCGTVARIAGSGSLPGCISAGSNRARPHSRRNWRSCSERGRAAVVRPLEVYPANAAWAAPPCRQLP
jgi:hypothetical protein